MSLLTPTQMREHIENDLSDTELQRVIDAAEQDIVQRYGPHVTQTDELDECQLSTALFLSRPAATITTVTEEIHVSGDIDQTVLSANDYDLTADGFRLRRLSSGDNPRATWGDVVVIAYVPVDESSKREGVEIAMVKLDIQFGGLDSEKVGDYAATQQKYEENRNKALSRLQKRMGIA